MTDEMRELLTALQRIRPLLEIGFSSVKMRAVVEAGEGAIEAMGWDHYALRGGNWDIDATIDIVSRIYEILPKPEDA